MARIRSSYDCVVEVTGLEPNSMLFILVSGFCSIASIVGAVETLSFGAVIATTGAALGFDCDTLNKINYPTTKLISYRSGICRQVPCEHGL